jgi:hypothetical protein
MHDRIHVNNLNLANAPQDIDVWKKSAVAGFDASCGKVEGFSSLNAGEHHKNIFEAPILRNREFFQKPKPSAV